MENQKIDKYTEENKKLKDEVAELKLKLKKALAQALTDSLTGLANRRAFDDEISKRARRHSRSIYENPENKFPENFSLILFDLDKFKSINDTFGHLVGDEILKKVASVTLEHIRANDFFVRYGGEEFAILVDGDVEIARTLAERIRVDIEKINLDEFKIDTKKRKNVTASFGISQYVWQQDSKLSLENMVKRADILLYNAKEFGRNRISDENNYF